MRQKLINFIFTYSFQTTPTILDPSPVSSMTRGFIRPTISSSSMARGMNRPVQGVRVIPEKNDRINRTRPREFRNKTVLRNSSPGNSQQPPRTRIFTADRKKLFRSKLKKKSRVFTFEMLDLFTRGGPQVSPPFGQTTGLLKSRRGS